MLMLFTSFFGLIVFYTNTALCAVEEMDQ